MGSLIAFTPAGWWVGFGVTSVTIAVLAALVVGVITTVNRLERQASAIVTHLDQVADATRPLLDLVETNEVLKGASLGA